MKRAVAALLCLLLPIGWSGAVGAAPQSQASVGATPAARGNDSPSATRTAVRKTDRGGGDGESAAADCATSTSAPATVVVANGRAKGVSATPAAGGMASARGDVRLTDDPRRIAYGLFLDTPLAPGTIDRSLRILAGLRCRYGLYGGVRDDEEAASRAFEEIDRLAFSRSDVARKAQQLGVSLDPSVCADACENFENMVVLRLRMDALERLATSADCPTR